MWKCCANGHGYDWKWFDVFEVEWKMHCKGGIELFAHSLASMHWALGTK